MKGVVFKSLSYCRGQWVAIHPGGRATFHASLARATNSIVHNRTLPYRLNKKRLVTTLTLLLEEIRFRSTTWQLNLWESKEHKEPNG